MKRREILYFEHMRRLTQDAIYDGLVGCGLFSEKLPPAFTSEPFLKFCKVHPEKLFCHDPEGAYNSLYCRQYVQHESNRNNSGIYGV